MKKIVFVYLIICLSNVAYAGPCQIQQQGPINSNSAIEFFNQALTYSSDKKGIYYDKVSDTEEAISCFDKAIELDPNILTLYGAIGSAYIAKGDLTQAMLAFNKAIAINPKSAQPHVGRGYIYAHRGNLTKGIAEYNKAIEMDSTLAIAYHGRAHAYARQGKFTQAIADYNKAVEIDPKNAVPMQAVHPSMPKEVTSLKP